MFGFAWVDLEGSMKVHCQIYRRERTRKAEYAAERSRGIFTSTASTEGFLARQKAIIMSDPILASQYFDVNPDSEEECEVEEGDDETTQRKNESNGKTTQVTRTLTFRVPTRPLH